MLESVTRPGTIGAVALQDAWAALTIFFAISGFVLTRAYGQTVWTRASLSRYAAARIGRIYPLYALSLLVVLPFIWQALRSSPDLERPAARVSVILNHLLLLQAWQWPTVNWNTPAWSLSCELAFYACAPAIVGLMRRPTWRRSVALAVLACALPAAARLLTAAPPKPFLYIGDFLIGAAASCLYDSVAPSRRRAAMIGPWLYWPAGVLAVVLLAMRHAGSPFLLFDTGFRLVIGALVFGLACGGGLVWSTIASPLAVAGGRTSYAIYILHVPLLWWWRYFRLDVILPPPVGAVAFVIAVQAIAYGVHRWYEMPADRSIRRWTAPGLSRTAAGRRLRSLPLEAR